MKSNGIHGISSVALNAAAPDRYGFDIADFKPMNVRGQLTPEAKETVRLQEIRQAMKVPLYQVLVTDESNETITASPKIARSRAVQWLERIEIAIKTGQLTGWRLPRLELVVMPDGLGICRGTSNLLSEGART